MKLRQSKKLTALLLTLCLITTCLPTASFAADEEPESKTVITSVDELMQFAQAVNNGDYDGKTDTVVSLEADLDMTGVDWVPMGYANDDGDIEHNFSGKFCGNGHTISNVTIGSETTPCENDLVGLFGAAEGTIEDLFLDTVTIHASAYAVGALVGYNASTITNCHAENVSFNISARCAGGLVGYLLSNSSIDSCSADGKIILSNNGLAIGGLAGGTGEDTQITYSRANVDLTAPKDSRGTNVGGFIGVSNGERTSPAVINNCYATGNVTGGAYTGAFTSSMAGMNIKNSYASGNVTDAGSGMATFAGTDAPAYYLNGAVQNCYTSGNVIGSAVYTGAFLYQNTMERSTLTNCYFVNSDENAAVKTPHETAAAKSLDEMKTAEFTAALNAGDENNGWTFRQGETPLCGAEPADYSAVETALAKIPADLTAYTEESVSAVNNAAANVVKGKVLAKQSEVDAMATAITEAVSKLTYKPADYSKVDEAIKKANALNKSEYKDFSAVEAAVNAVIRDKNVTEQAEVDKMAQAIEDAIAALEKCKWDMNFTICENGDSCPLHKFTDVDAKKWYHEGVHFCLDNSIMQGTDKGFEPQVITTRAMITTMLWRLDGEPKASYSMTFKDVADGQWYTEAVRWAQSTGIVNGYDNNTFGTNDGMTREQVVTVMHRYAKYKGYDVSAAADLSKFADADSVSDWAVDAVKWAVDTGIIVGDTRNDGRILVLDPQGSSTRAQAATMLMRYCTTILK